eukprot:4131103-Amphidinium_carterae.1
MASDIAQKITKTLSGYENKGINSNSKCSSARKTRRDHLTVMLHGQPNRVLLTRLLQLSSECTLEVALCSQERAH